MQPFIALDFPAASADGDRSTAWFSDPIEILEAHAIDQVRGVLERVDERVRGGHHVVGFVSYEAGPAFDRAIAGESTRRAAARVVRRVRRTSAD